MASALSHLIPVAMVAVPKLYKRMSVNNTKILPKQRQGRAAVVVMLSMVACAGCVTHRHTITGVARSPVAPADVRIYLEPLATPYLEIALVEASSMLSWAITADAKTDVVIRRLQREAAALGANGIVLQDMNGDDGAVGAGLAPDISRDHQSIGVFFLGPGSTQVGRGTAIFVAPP